MLDVSVDLKGFELKNPIIMASGTCGYSDEFDVFCDTSSLGAIVTKGITLEPRLGNEGQRLFETYGGMINRIGLENIGIHKFIEEKLPILHSKNIQFILNIAGNTIEDYIEIAKICEMHSIKAIELNVSCPNVKSGCIEFGVNEDALFELVLSVRKNYKGFLIVKLTPNVTSLEVLALAAEKAGANAISAINTLKGLGVKVNCTNGEFKTEFVSGGLSGMAIKPVALAQVRQICQVVDIPVIAMGGISSFEDMLEFFAVGAAAIQIGTANFTNPDVCETILTQLQDFMTKNGFKNLEELKSALKSASVGI